MAVTAVYPNGILPWTPRVNNKDTVWAADPNQLAAEVQAIEGAVGTNPNIEFSPPTGTAITYANMSSRLHDVQLGNQVPVVQLYHGAITLPAEFYANQGNVNNAPGRLTSWSVNADPYHFYNGNDVSVPVDGWYVVTMKEYFYWSASGIVMNFLFCGGYDYVDSDFFNFTFPENFYKTGDYSGTQAPGYGGFEFLPQGKTLRTSWEGALTAGSRVYTAAWNESGSQALATIGGGAMTVRWVRSIPSGY
jgi:hypothetical protein